MLYGFSPFAEGAAPSAPVAPVVKALKARLIHVADHPDALEASASPYMLGGAQRTGVIALGTGDGMRGFSRGRPMHVLVRGRPVSIIGVSLEHTVLALDGIDEAQPGDEVTLIGQSDRYAVSLADWAFCFDCSQLEVAVSMLGRLPKRYTPQYD